MKRLARLMLTASSLAIPAMDADYDLVINNGLVRDPEALYDNIANVFVKDDKIAAITRRRSTAGRPLTPRAWT